MEIGVLQYFKSKIGILNCRVAIDKLFWKLFFDGNPKNKIIIEIQIEDT